MWRSGRNRVTLLAEPERIGQILQSKLEKNRKRCYSNIESISTAVMLRPNTLFMRSCVRYPFFSRLPTYDKKLRRKISRFCFFLVLPSINAEKCHSPFFTGDRRCGCLFLRPSAVDCFRKTAFMIVMRDSQNAGCVKKTARCIFGF